MPKKPAPFRMRETDKLVYANALDDLGIFTEYYFDWEPFGWQQQFYHAPQQDKLVVAGVRSGKTKVVAAGFLHFMLYHPNCRIANASISADQATIVYYDCLDFAMRPQFQHLVEKVERHPYPLIRLVNGSEAWFRSVGYEAELWRGWEFDWINIDEAAYIPNEMAMVTLKGRLLGRRRVYGEWRHREGLFTMTTSPKGKTWLFKRFNQGWPEYPQHEEGDLETYLSIRARTFDNPALSPKILAEITRNMTKKQIQQEMEGLFVDSDSSQFEYDDIMLCCTPIVKDPVTKEVKAGRQEVTELVVQVNRWMDSHNASESRREDIDLYELEPIPGHYYVNSWDIGFRPTKVGRNATVGGVIDITERPWKLVAYAYLPGVSYAESQERIEQWQRKYNSRDATCETIMDATGKGDVISQELQQRKLNVEGFAYSTQSKALMITSLRLAVERQWLVFPFIKRMVDQLQIYEVPDDKIPQDIVMMLAQACMVARRRNGELGRDVARDLSVIASGRRSMDDPAMQRMFQRRQMSRSRRLPGRVR